MIYSSEVILDVTCNVVSMSVNGAGLTSVTSCAAAEVMVDPADRMEGCMRGVSDSRVNIEFGEGKVKELAVTSASICSTDDSMMLARAFISATVSCGTLSNIMLSDISSSAVRHEVMTYLVA